jgi:oxygen-dependent protoporphyrinogen oxidase
MTPVRVVVVGAGMAGLSAAHAIRRRARQEGWPLSLQVLESCDRAGGHVGTVREDGFVVETGPNGYLSGQPATERLVAELGLGTELVEARSISTRRFLVRHGRLRRLPLTPLGLLATRALSLRGRVRTALEPWIPARQADGDESVYEFGRRRFGREAAELLGDAIVAGTTGGEAVSLSMAATYPALVDMERRHGSVVRGMLAQRRAGIPRPTVRSFARGMSVLVDALTRELGPSLSVGQAVTRLGQEAGAWRIDCAGREPRWADHVILAAPTANAAAMLADDVPSLRSALRAVPSAGIVVVAFAWRAGDLGRPLDGYGFLVPRREGLFTLGMVWESSLFPGRAPEGWALVRLMLGGARTPAVTELSEGDVLRVAEGEAGRLLKCRRPPTRAWLFRWPAAVPQYVMGHRERVVAIRQAAGALRGLELCGTWYDGISFNSAVASGAAAASRIPVR